MKILVTGGAGFLGSSLCQRLLGQGHEVWAADNLLTGEPDNLQPLLENPKFHFKQCGVESAEFLEFCRSVKFGHVFHLACPTGVPNIELLGEEMLKACSTGTWQVLQVALGSGAELLFTSTSEIYGQPRVSPQDESYLGDVDPTGPRANYEEGKRFAETLVSWFVSHYHLKAKIVRLFNAYGPNMSRRDTRLVPRFARQALSGQPLTVHGDGSQTRTLCYVDDILDGLELVMNKGEVGGVYNLGSDQPVAVKDVAELILKISGSSSKLKITPRPYHDHESRKPALGKIEKLGWRQKVGLEQGLKQTLAAFKQRELQTETQPAAVQDVAAHVEA